LCNLVSDIRFNWGWIGGIDDGVDCVEQKTLQSRGFHKAEEAAEGWAHKVKVVLVIDKVLFGEQAAEW
jgi:hypothetical protein